MCFYTISEDLSALSVTCRLDLCVFDLECLKLFLIRAPSSFFTDSPRSTLTVTPDSPVFTGETVNLKCVIESYSNWRYEWYKDSVMLQTSVNRDTLTIRGVNESDQGQYWCRGRIRSVSSQSNSVYLSVTGELNIIVLINSLYCIFDHLFRKYI